MGVKMENEGREINRTVSGDCEELGTDRDVSSVGGINSP